MFGLFIMTTLKDIYMVKSNRYSWPRVHNIYIYIYIYKYIFLYMWLYFGKPTMLSQILKSIFCPSHTHALSRHSSLDGQVCFCRRLLSNAVKPQGCILWLVWPLRGINKTAWGAKLFLMADLVYQMSCARLGHLLMARHCHLCLNVCFSLPMARHPPTPYRLNPHYYICRKNYLKNQGHSNGL